MGLLTAHLSGDLHPGENAIRTQLVRMLSSNLFLRAPILSRFLSYLVESSLGGDTDKLKEYTLGVDVFKRGPDFDPRVDTIVRVHARRLRAKLDEYYRGQGREDSIVLTVPTGHYVPQIRFAVHPRPDSRSLHAPGQRKLMRSGCFPAPRTPLIGRDAQLTEIEELLLNAQSRLVTLAGPGGSGKTRLAYEVSGRMTRVFTGGVYLAALASVADPTGVPTALAQALGLHNTGGAPLLDALQQHVRRESHGPALLVADDFEHVMDAAPFLGQLLDGCPDLKILVTSREVLHIYGEWEYAVPPLAVPDVEVLPQLDELAANPAVCLFIERARAAKPSFRLTGSNAHALAMICASLDGLPLSIELAAPHIRTIEPEALLQQLATNIDFLTSPIRDRPYRQRALRNTFDWSYNLLTDAEQKLFRRLSVFVGGFQPEGAEAVCDTGGDLGIGVHEGLASLVDKSLVQQRPGDDPSIRFFLQETSRQYGLSQLESSREMPATRKAHAAYCLVLAEESNLAQETSVLATWLGVCEAEHENIRSALHWVIANDEGEWAIRMGLALYWFWETRELLVEGRDYLDAILAMNSIAENTESRARLLGRAASLRTSLCEFGPSLELHRESLEIHRQLGDERGMIAQLSAIGANEVILGDLAGARDCFQEGLALCRSRNDPSAVAAMLSNLAEVLNTGGEHAQAFELHSEALSIFRERGEWAGVAWALNHLADVARDLGDVAEAHHLYEESQDIFRRLNHQWGMARSAADLGALACDQGQYSPAAILFNEALDLFLGIGHRRGVANVFEGLACLAALQNQSERALTLAGAAASLRESIKTRPRLADEARLDRLLGPLRADPESADTAWMDGHSMSLTEATRFAAGAPS